VLSIAVFYTADIVTPDGSDTGVYGDPCEPGHGATLESGWVDMDYDQWTVYDDSSDVRPDLVEGETLTELAESTADAILSRIGVPESLDNHSTIYGADADQNHRTGQEAMRAAHLYLPGHVHATPNDIPDHWLAAVHEALQRRTGRR
jgi:hypothetical protein